MQEVERIRFILVGLHIIHVEQGCAFETEESVFKTPQRIERPPSTDQRRDVIGLQAMSMLERRQSILVASGMPEYPTFTTIGRAAVLVQMNSPIIGCNRFFILPQIIQRIALTYISINQIRIEIGRMFIGMESLGITLVL